MGRVSFPKKDLRGSRLGCLMLTSGSARQVAHRLTDLVTPYALVDPDHDKWMPRGFLKPKEAKLVKTERLLSAECCNALTEWWLANPRGANRPNWDIASTATIQGRKGLLLIEAKAHNAELSSHGKSTPTGSKASAQNDSRIRTAIRQASNGLGGGQTGWHLSADSHYQLSNRFAWSWKIAERGVPVILVYLGFLNAEDMADQRFPFRSADQWADVVHSHAKGTVPQVAWNRRIEIAGTALQPIIRATDFQWRVSCAGR